MGRRRKGRAINGIFLLNKGLGGSSNQVLQQVRRIYGAAKAGHTGALDPLATGMLPICLGEATKFSQFLLDADKTYEVTAKLGIRTTTSDADGDVVETKPVDVSREQLEAACSGFVGHSKQIPSMFSALKYQGKPLYHYARQGIEVPREARDIHIYALEILRFETDEVDMRVHCSKGTYIRSLVDDIGQLLSCGAYVTRLHRTQVSDYPNDKMMSVEALEAIQSHSDSEAVQAPNAPSKDYSAIDSLLLPMDTVLKGLPQQQIDDNEVVSFTHGQGVKANADYPVGQSVRIYARSEGRFLGVGEADDSGVVMPKRVVVYND